MRTRSFLGPLTLSVFLALAAAFGIAGCAEEGPFERAGEEVDDAVDEAGDAAEDVRDEVEDAVDEVRDN